MSAYNSRQIINRFPSASKDKESGFTLVELLVVILIIGILAAIAIPVFLNQRQRANDASVESDVRNVATAIESQLISSPNASTIEGASNGAGHVNVEVADTEPETVPLSDGVNIEIEGYGQSSDGSDLHANGYKIYGWHDNGRQYDGDPDALVYDSALGGFQAETGVIVAETPVTCFSFSTSHGYILGYNNTQEGCTSDVIIPREIDGIIVTGITNSAFQGRNLTSVVIPDSVTTIRTSAFQDNNLTSVIIPEGVEEISGRAFQENDLTSIVIPSTVTLIGGNAFSSNELTSVVIPEGVEEIAGVAFRRNNLTSVTIPDSVNVIGQYAFRENSLTTVELPAHTTYIEEGTNRTFDSPGIVSRR